MDTVRLIIVYFLIIFITSQATPMQSNIFAQQSPRGVITVESGSKGKNLSKGERSHDELLLKYVQFFSEEAEKHRRYISWIFSLLAGVVTILIFMLGFFNYRSRKEIVESVNDFFHREIEKQFQMKLKGLQDSVSTFSDMINKSNSYFKSLSRAVLVTSDIGNEENPFDEKKLIGKEILWVDDKQYNIDDYKLLLKNLGVIVTLEKTTAATVERLNKEKFDLIISNMGREDDGSGKTAGLDLLKEIQVFQTLPKIPIVIFTRPEKRDLYKNEAITLGAYDVVSGFLGILKAIVNILAR